MVSFSSPLPDHSFFHFSVESGSVAFAGSRRGFVSPDTCRLLIDRFGQLGFAFRTGCADGVDTCFRSALADSDYADATL